MSTEQIAAFLVSHVIFFACVSAVFSVGSLIGTVRAELKYRRIRRAESELETQGASLAMTRQEVAEIQNYLEKTPTSYFPVARYRKPEAH